MRHCDTRRHIKMVLFSRGKTVTDGIDSDQTESSAVPVLAKTQKDNVD